MLVTPQAFFFSKEKLQIIRPERKTAFSPFSFSSKQNSGAGRIASIEEQLKFKLRT
jgi:hypothetical protein